jgi:hypothetical protein
VRAVAMVSDEGLPLAFHKETELREGSSQVRSRVKARRTAEDGKVCAMNLRKKLTKTYSGRSGCFGA